MPRKPKPLEPLDLSAIEALAGHVSAAGIPQRQLASDAGMSLNRVGIILRAEGPGPTVGEIGALCSALGLRTSEVIREAEGNLGAATTVPVPSSPVPEATVTDLGSRRRGLGRGVSTDPPGQPAPPAAVAAREVTERPEWEAMHRFDDVGEESQAAPDENDEQ